jgi:hypothetical protein
MLAGVPGAVADGRRTTATASSRLPAMGSRLRTPAEPQPEHAPAAGCSALGYTVQLDGDRPGSARRAALIGSGTDGGLSTDASTPGRVSAGLRTMM